MRRDGASNRLGFALTHGRGLKQAVDGVRRDGVVRPHAWAWIETLLAGSTGAWRTFALTHGRGLKPSVRYTERGRLCSPSRMGVD